MFHPSEVFDVDEMAAFMRRPDIYGPLTDALAPAPEQICFEEYLAQPTTWTMGCLYGPHIIGYVQLIQRSSVCAEVLWGFNPHARGLVAKQFITYTLSKAWRDRGLMALYGMVPEDNLVSRRMARSTGFTQTGRIPRSIVRVPQPYKHRPARQPGLYDLLIYSQNKPTGN